MFGPILAGVLSEFIGRAERYTRLTYQCSHYHSYCSATGDRYLRDYSVLSLDLLRVELVVKLARFIQTLVLPFLSSGYQQYRYRYLPFQHVFLMGNKINR